MYICPVCGNKKYSVIKNMYDDRYGAPGKHKILLCKKCSFGKTIPGLTDSEIPSFYSKYYPLRKITENDVIASVDRHTKFQRWLMGTNNVAHQYVKRGSTVLDIGSASGVSLLEIAERGAIAYGVEPDINAQKIARNLKLKVFKGLITENPYPFKKFDYVTASNVLEHTSNPQLFMSCVYKKLKRNGKLIICFPNVNSIYRLLFGKHWINWHIPYHLNHISKKSIVTIAHNTGYHIDKVRTITPNLWTSLQIVSVFSKSKYRKPSPIWTGEYKKNIVSRMLKVTNGLTVNIAGIIFLPINRILDFVGIGDCTLVFLSKK